MRVDDFDFSLPPERIALRPAGYRATMRGLLVVRPGQPLVHAHVPRLAGFLARPAIRW